MKENLLQLFADYPAPFNEWPEEAQRRFVLIIQHYCNNDQEKFKALAAIAREWATEEGQQVPPDMVGSTPGPDMVGSTPLS